MLEFFAAAGFVVVVVATRITAFAVVVLVGIGVPFVVDVEEAVCDIGRDEYAIVGGQEFLDVGGGKLAYLLHVFYAVTKMCDVVVGTTEFVGGEMFECGTPVPIGAQLGAQLL